MKSFRTLLAALCIASALPAFADEAETQALRVLEASGAKAQMEQMTSQMLDLQLQRKPTLAPYRDVLLEFLNEYMGYDSLVDEVVKIYTDAFTADELRQIADFNESPVGQKANSVMPQISMQLMGVVMQRVQANSGELEARIQAEVDRIRELQGE